jgi:hypothetical protein
LLPQKLLGKPGYRHHIHSPGGWASLVRKAGFHDQQVMTPLFTYQFPAALVAAPSRGRLKAAIANARLRLPEGYLKASTSISQPKSGLKVLFAGIMWRLFRLHVSHDIVIVARKSQAGV